MKVFAELFSKSDPKKVAKNKKSGIIKKFKMRKNNNASESLHLFFVKNEILIMGK